MIHKMTKKYSIAVIGATGNVGRHIINTLHERSFPVASIIAAASEKSIGKKVSFGDETLTITAIKEIDFSKIDIAFFCAGSAISAQYAKDVAKAGCIVIDKSSFFRLQDDIALVIPEVNITKIDNIANENGGMVIASPNCCVIPLCVALKPLDNAVKIKRITISTYQSVSGAGKSAMDELYIQTKAKFVFEALEPKALPSTIAFNVIPQIGNFRPDGYSDEEYKIQAETKKILRDNIEVNVTAVRVPVFVSHCLSVNIDFADEFDAKEAEEILSEAEGIIVYNTSSEIKYAMPIDVVEEDAVFVSRIRNQIDNKKHLNMWICADNLRKGAALNAVQIAEYVIKS
jgi:aspartate-semialdehyde dehydrogenase